MDRSVARRVLLYPGLLRLRPAATRHASVAAPHTARALSTVPRIAEASFWKSLVPKPLRRENRPVREPTAPAQPWRSKQWNPATFFIIIFLLIGSMSIQMISLRKNFDAHTRRSEVRIDLLREVVERIQNGEEVDVETVLGSGDPEKEAVWEEVLSEIEKDTAARNQRKHNRSKAPEPSPPPPPPTAKTVSTPEPGADAAPAQEQPKGRTAYFF